MQLKTNEELIESLLVEVSKLRELDEVLKKVNLRATVEEYEELSNKLPNGMHLYVITSEHLSQILMVLNMTANFIEEDVNSLTLSELTDESATMDSGEQR